MVWHRFLACNAAGGAVWASLMGLAGYTFGQVALRMGGIVGMGLAVLATMVMVMTMITLQRTEHRLKEKVACAPVEEWGASAKVGLQNR